MALVIAYGPWGRARDLITDMPDPGPFFKATLADIGQGDDQPRHLLFGWRPESDKHYPCWATTIVLGTDLDFLDIAFNCILKHLPDPLQYEWEQQLYRAARTDKNQYLSDTRYEAVARRIPIRYPTRRNIPELAYMRVAKDAAKF